MKVVFEQDSYVASTWGHAEHFKAGEPKEVGKDFGVLCLQNGAKEYEEALVGFVYVPSQEYISQSTLLHINFPFPPPYPP